jgi:transcriptional regulator with XRE-family HTH domain
VTTVDTTTAWAPQRKQVRDALAAQGMSQAKLARRIGISPKHLSQMLTGASDGKLDHWAAMARELGLEWQLRPPDLNVELANWAREQLGLDIEPRQAARLRQHVAGEL